MNGCRDVGPTVADVLERMFLPHVCPQASGEYQNRFRVAARWFNHSLGREARTSDLSIDAVDLFTATLANADYSRGRIQILRRSLMTFWEFADRLGLAPPFVDRRLEPPRSLFPARGRRGSPLRGWSNGKRIDMPPPEPGTLRLYFEEIYRPQQIPLAEATTLASYRTVFLTFWRWLGRDASFDDCRSDRYAAYVAWALELGLRPRSINGYRACWLAVWRHAHRAGLTEPLPTSPPLPADRDEPDAWTMEELSRLVASAETFRADRHLGGVPYPLLMRVILIVGFHIAVRRRTLLSLAQADVDLASGMVTVRPRTVKTRRGQRFQLPPYAVAAIRDIWEPRRELLFPITPMHAYRVFRQLIAHAGLPPSTHALGYFHKLRRTAATQAAILGGIKEASELLGHSEHYVTNLYVDRSKLPGNATSAKLPAIDGAGGELAEARDLLAAGKPHLAAMAARVVLQRRVGQRCSDAGSQRTTTIAKAAELLKLHGLISEHDCRALRRAAVVARRAAGGRVVDATAAADLIEVAAHFAGGKPTECHSEGSTQ